MLPFWIVIEEEDRPGEVRFAVALGEGTLTIGRAPTSDLVLPSNRISRSHLTLERQGDEVRFRDLGSRGGTFLNGGLAREGLLRPGDRLVLGDHALVVVDEAGMRSMGQRATPGTSVRGSARPRAPLVDWEPFRAFAEALRSQRDPGAILERLLVGLVDLFAGEGGFVVLGDRTDELPPPVVSHGPQAADPTISHTIYKRVLETGRTVFVANTTEDPWYQAASSSSLGLVPRSILCGPLKARGRVFGVIYVDGSAELDDAHIPAFETVTGLASELLAAAETRDRLVATGRRIGAIQAAAWRDDELVVGSGVAGQTLRRLIEVGASQDVSVLVTGETGTGKEMVARAVHRLSRRGSEPFVPVHCAALARDILEAELFGVEKGAYTGADASRMGRFEMAQGGTLFLDELGDLPPEVQVKLLRVLQDHTVTRVGAAEAIHLDLRLVAATNVDLEDAVRRGAFRQDLYYRINVFRIHLLPLRERPEEIPLLARHFLGRLARRFGRGAVGFSPEAEALLRGHPWPGNVRELRNAIERALLVRAGTRVEAADLPIAPARASAPAALRGGDWLPPSVPEGYDAARLFFERAFLARCMARARGNVTVAARSAGMNRSSFYRRLARVGLSTSRWDSVTAE